MRTPWIVTIITILISMGLAVVILGQYQQLSKVQLVLWKQQKEVRLRNERAANQESFRISVQNLETEAKKAAKDAEAKLNNLVSEMEKKKTESEACQTDKKRTNDDVEEQNKAHTETEATLKSEAEAWKKEIETLKEQLKEFSPVCKHVKQDPLADKLCGIERTEAPKPPEAPAAPANPEAPEAPANPEAPAAKANAEAPAAPANPEAPAAPANPEAPAAKANPEAPAAPANPEAPAAPANPEAPAAPANPEAPAAPAPK